MTKLIYEIGASSWFYYKEICYDARSHECKIPQDTFALHCFRFHRTCNTLALRNL